MKKNSVKLIECIRNTWQGEGINSGQRFTLLRGKYCNRRCKWCDTLVKMRISQEAEYRISDIQKILDEERTNLMISGGEPTFEKHFDDTFELLTQLKYEKANVESNGYLLYHLDELLPDSLSNIKLMYSPKIFSDKELKQEIDKTIKLFPLERVYIKVVYEDNELIHEYLKLLSDLMLIDNIKNKNSKIWLMPEGTTREALIRNSQQVFDICEQYKFNFSSRNHIIFGFV